MKVELKGIQYIDDEKKEMGNGLFKFTGVTGEYKVFTTYQSSNAINMYGMKKPDCSTAYRVDDKKAQIIVGAHKGCGQRCKFCFAHSHTEPVVFDENIVLSLIEQTIDGFNVVDEPLKIVISKSGDLGANPNSYEILKAIKENIDCKVIRIVSILPNQVPFSNDTSVEKKNIQLARDGILKYCREYQSNDDIHLQISLCSTNPEYRKKNVPFGSSFEEIKEFTDEYIQTSQGRKVAFIGPMGIDSENSWCPNEFEKHLYPPNSDHILIRFRRMQ